MAKMPLAAYFTVHPQTPKARASFAKFFSVVMKGIGRRWNAMDSGALYELLLKQYPPCDSTSKYSLQKWNQLTSGAKVAVFRLMVTKDKAARPVATSRAVSGASTAHRGKKLRSGVNK